MKITLLLLIGTGLLIACNNDKKPGNQSPTIIATASNTDDSVLEKKLTTLQQLTPYTADEMKAMIPIAINNDSTTNAAASENMGAGFVSADYKLSDSTSVGLSIFDCAGNAGAGIYNAQYAGLLNSRDDNLKIISFKGGKAIEHDDAERNNHSLMYMAHDRLLVTLEGKNISLAEVKEIAGNLKLK